VKLDHLSYSSVNQYHLCPSAWKRHYIDKVQTPTATALVFGGAFHETIEAYIYGKHGDDATDFKAANLATLSLTDLWTMKWEAKQKEEPNIDWGNETPATLHELGTRMLDKLDVSGGGANRTEMASEFLSKIVPMMDNGKPAIEKKVTLSVPGVPVPVIGYIDIITADGIPCDFKTSGKAWYQEKANAELQPLFYLAAMAQAGEPVPDGKFRFYVFTKAKAPKAQILEVKHKAGELLWLLDHIRQTWESIQAGIFTTRAGSFKCKPRRKANGEFNKYWCEYWDICRGAFL
jgi:hypothetical protein